MRPCALKHVMQKIDMAQTELVPFSLMDFLAMAFPLNHPTLELNTTHTHDPYFSSTTRGLALSPPPSPNIPEVAARTQLQQ